MKFENTEVMNFSGAFRGMRNPMDSWDRSDSQWHVPYYADEHDTDPIDWFDKIGDKDIELAQKLIAAGPEHRKFLRQIFVSVDITGALFWWKEFDTYKVGTVANSCSTMHKIAAYPITLESFEIDDFRPDIVNVSGFIELLETMRVAYNETKDKRIWKELIRWLPESWLQKRTVTLSYENIRQIVRQRANHKLTEWHRFIDWARTLPYADELIFYNGNDAQEGVKG